MAVGDTKTDQVTLTSGASTTVVPPSGDVACITDFAFTGWSTGANGKPRCELQIFDNVQNSCRFYRDGRIFAWAGGQRPVYDNANFFRVTNQLGATHQFTYIGTEVQT